MRVVAVLVLAAGLVAAQAPAPSSASRPAAETRAASRPFDFDAAAERIRRHAAGTDSKKPGFRDAEIEAWIDALVADAREKSGATALRVPARFADVAPPRGKRPEAFRPQCLLASNDVNIAGVERAIVLVDGNARIAHARDSVLVVRGSAVVAHLHGCVLIAGRSAVVSHADRYGRGADRADVAGPPSLVCVGESAFLGFAYGTVVSAPGVAEFSWAHAPVVFDAATYAASWEPTPTKRAAGRPVGAPAAVPHALTARSSLSYADRKDDAKRSRAGLSVDGVADAATSEGAALSTAAADFAGWRIALIEDRFVTLTNGREDAVLYPPTR